MGGSSSKGGSQTQTTVQENAPPSWAAPHLKYGVNESRRLYDQGKGGNVYEGQRVADLGQGTQNAIGGMNNAAGGFNNPAFHNILNGGTASGNNLADMASGKMIGNNTRFNEALQNTLNNTANTINSQMSGAGRYGSGAHSGVMANNLGQAATNAMAQQYNQDMQNMMGANQQIDAANQGLLGAGGSFLGNQSNAWNNALQGNSLIDQNNQNKLNADWQRWQENDNRDWSRLGMLQQGVTGFTGNYGTSTGTSTGQQRSNPWQAINGGLGAVGGLIGKSDMRAKENIKQVGERNGWPLYEFNYIGKPERFRGVMAQDVLAKMPEAVSVDPADGLYQVDYAKVGVAMERLN